MPSTGVNQRSHSTTRLDTLVAPTWLEVFPFTDISVVCPTTVLVEGKGGIPLPVKLVLLAASLQVLSTTLSTAPLSRIGCLETFRLHFQVGGCTRTHARDGEGEPSPPYLFFFLLRSFLQVSQMSMYFATGQEITDGHRATKIPTIYTWPKRRNGLAFRVRFFQPRY